MVLFALFSMNNGARANVPLVSYATMADIWFEVNSVLTRLVMILRAKWNIKKKQSRRSSVRGINPWSVPCRFCLAELRGRIYTVDSMVDIQVCMVLVFLTIFEFCLFTHFVDKGQKPFTLRMTNKAL